MAERKRGSEGWNAGTARRLGAVLVVGDPYEGLPLPASGVMADTPLQPAAAPGAVLEAAPPPGAGAWADLPPAAGGPAQGGAILTTNPYEGLPSPASGAAPLPRSPFAEWALRGPVADAPAAAPPAAPADAATLDEPPVPTGRAYPSPSGFDGDPGAAYLAMGGNVPPPPVSSVPGVAYAPQPVNAFRDALAGGAGQARPMLASERFAKENPALHGIATFRDFLNVLAGRGPVYAQFLQNMDERDLARQMTLEDRQFRREDRDEDRAFRREQAGFLREDRAEARDLRREQIEGARADRAAGLDLRREQAAEATQTRQREQAANFFLGLRAARDRGEDIGAAYDRMARNLANYGIGGDNAAQLRQAIVDSKGAVLDDLVLALGGKLPEGPKAAAAAGAKDAQKALKDYADLTTTLQGSVALIDRLASPEREVAVRSIFGTPSFSGALGSGGLGSLGSVPGTEAADAATDLEGLVSQTRLQAYETLKGSGAISNAESEFAGAALAQLGRAQSYEHFQESLAEYRRRLGRIEKNARIRAGIDQPDDEYLQRWATDSTAPVVGTPGAPPAAGNDNGGFRVRRKP